MLKPTKAISRPSRGAKIEAAKKLKEAQSDEETLSLSDAEGSLSVSTHKDEMTSMFEKEQTSHLKAIENPSLSKEISNQRETTDETLIETKKRGRPRKNQVDFEVKQPALTDIDVEKKELPASNPISMSLENNSDVLGNLTKPQESLSIHSQITQPQDTEYKDLNANGKPKMNFQTTAGQDESNEKNFVDKINSSNSQPAKRRPGRPRKKKRSDDDKAAQPPTPKAEVRPQFPLSNIEKKGPGRPTIHHPQPEQISSTIATAVNYYLSSPTNSPLKPHASHLVEAKIGALKNISHINAARSMRHGQSYSDLSLLTKIEILEFLADEFLATYPISHELLHRHRMTSYYQGKYGLLPTKNELKHLTNVDECVVCGIEGDLVCCDGCIASFHYKCTDLPMEDDLPEVWLCPDCRISNPAKFGPLYGGSKCDLDWFSIQDFLPVVMSQKLSNSLSNLKEENAEVNNLLLGQSENLNDGKEQYSTVAQKPLSSPEKNAESNGGNELKQTMTELLNGSKRQKLEEISSSSVKLSNPNLKPTISASDEREFLIIHGFVFTRHKQAPSPNTAFAPTPLSQSKLYSLLRSLGPQYSLTWPWYQIPFDPFDIWHDLSACLDETTHQLFEQKRNLYRKYFLTSESHNPCSYKNVYRKAQLPAYVSMIQSSIKSKPTFRRGEVLRLQNVQGLTRDLNQDSNYIKTLLSHTSLYDDLHVCKEYIIKLEKTLVKSCLLSELWGINKQAIPNLWIRRVLKCSSVPKLAKLCVELVDGAHSRVFYDDWNKSTVQSRSKQSNSTTTRTNILLTDDWTPQKECQKRVWERSTLRDCLRLLSNEGNRFGGLVPKRKNRQILKWNQHDHSLPTLRNPNLIHKAGNFKGKTHRTGETLKSKGFDRGPHEGETKTHSNLAMTPGAIRARKRRRQEKEEREKMKQETLMKLKIENESVEKMMELEAAQENKLGKDDLDETDIGTSMGSKNNSESIENIGDKKKNVKKRRKKHIIPLGSRRRSGRHIVRPISVEGAMNALHCGNPNEESMERQKDDSIDFEIQKMRRSKLAAVEKLLNKNADKETHWPICGSFFFPPLGSLPGPILKRLARNAGMRPAPFMTYSNKFEVAQPSVSHCWRKKTIESKTVQELSLQLTILDSFINRPTVHSCEALGRRSTQSKSTVPKVIKCSQLDSETGVIEHFVVNRKKNKGVWLSEEAVDQSALILERSNRIEKQQNKFYIRISEKLRKEKEIKDKQENLMQEKRMASANLQNIQSHILKLQNSIITAKKEILSRQENLKKTEKAVSDSQLEVDKAQKQLDYVQHELRDEIEAHKKKIEMEKNATVMAKYAKVASEDQLEKAFMEYIDNDIQSINSQQTKDQYLLGKGGGKSGHRINGRGNNRIQENIGGRYIQIRSSLSSNFEDEETLKKSFNDAVEGHRTATMRLLHESAELGLNTVPAKKMHDARIRNMEAMKKANDKLRMINSLKCVDDDGLTKALIAAEDDGLNMYVNQAERKNTDNEPSSNFDGTMQNYPVMNRGLNGRKENVKHTDPQSFRDKARDKHRTGSRAHQSNFDRSSYLSFEQQRDNSMGAMGRQLSKQQQFQHLNEQPLLSTAQTSYSQPDHSDYAAMSNALAQSELNMLIQQPRRQLEVTNNVGQSVNNELANHFVLENQSRDAGRSILDNSKDLRSPQFNNEMLMQPNQFGDHLMGGIRQQLTSRNQNVTSFHNAPSNMQVVQAQQFSGQYSNNYPDPSVAAFDQLSVNGASYPFNQQAHQQRQSQPFIRGSQQQVSRSQNDQGHTLQTGYSQQNNNAMDFNIW